VTSDASFGLRRGNVLIVAHRGLSARQERRAIDALTSRPDRGDSVETPPSLVKRHSRILAHGSSQAPAGQQQQTVSVLGT
jgi:hypothetical protein